MKYIIALIVLSLSAVSVVSASTGSTSTGSTSTGVVSTGSISSPIRVGGGAPTRMFNFTTKQIEMVPQCFPWTWLTSYKTGNIFDIYINQKACQVQRFVDFGM